MALLSSSNKTDVLGKLRLGYGPTEACGLLTLAVADFEETIAADAAFGSAIKGVFQTLATDALSKLARKARSGDVSAAGELLGSLGSLPFVP